MQSWKTSDLTGVKVGDWVWVDRKGWREVTKVNRHPKNYSVEVSNCETFSLNGLYVASNKYPSCFPECPHPDGPPKPVTIYRPDFEVDHRVHIKACEDQEWSNGYFARWPQGKDNPGIYAFRSRRTKWSSGGDEAYYRYWKDGEKG